MYISMYICICYLRVHVYNHIYLYDPLRSHIQTHHCWSVAWVWKDLVDLKPMAGPPWSTESTVDGCEIHAPKGLNPQKNNGINMDKPSTGARFLNHPQQNREQWCFIMLYRQQKHLQGGEQGQNFDPYDRFGQLGDAWRCLDLEEIEVWSLRSRLGQNLKPEWTLKTGGPGNPQRSREELTGNLDVFLRREFTIQSLG